MDADERGDTSIWCHSGSCAICEDHLCECDCHYEEEPTGARGPILVARVITSTTAALIGATVVVYTWRKVLPEFPMPPLTTAAARGLVVLAVGTITIRTIHRIMTREEQSA
jgi:hypothetical protein